MQLPSVVAALRRTDVLFGDDDTVARELAVNSEGRNLSGPVSEVRSVWRCVRADRVPCWGDIARLTSLVGCTTGSHKNVLRH